jgi:RNA polymerase sigma factor (sigma-70 family)
MTETVGVDDQFKLLFQEHHQNAIQYTRRVYGVDFDTADQLVTDAFLCLLKALRNGDQINHANAWLRRSIQFHHATWFRRASNIHRGGAGREGHGQHWTRINLHNDIAIDTFDGFAAVDCHDAFEHATTHLDARDRRIVCGLAKGLSVPDLANEFGTSLRTMERYAAHARERLREPLTTLCEP